MKILVLRTIGGNVDSKNPIQLPHDLIWDKPNKTNYGVADYYKNTDISKSWDFYDQILEWNGGQTLNLQQDDIGLILGVYDDKYYKIKERYSLIISDVENYPSFLKPYGNPFVLYNQRGGIGIDIQFSISHDNKINKYTSKQLNSILIDRKRKQESIKSAYPALCFTLDYNSNLDLINQLSN